MEHRRTLRTHQKEKILERDRFVCVYCLGVASVVDHVVPFCWSQCDDEDNLVICQMAKRRFHVPRTIAKVNNPQNEDIFKRLGIDTTVSGTKIIFNLIEQQIETNEVIPLAPLQRGNIELVEVDLGPDSPVVGKRIAQMSLPQDALIVSIVRDGKAILPNIDVEFKEGDSVIALVNADKEAALRDAFAEIHPRSA